MGEEDKMRGAEDCATVWDRRRRGWNGVERVESLGPVTLTVSLEWRRRLGTAARVGPAVRELADLALSEWGWGLREGGRRGFWLLSLLSEGGRELVLKNRRNERLDLGLDYKGYIYRRGSFVIYSTRFLSGPGLRFFNKTRTRPGPASGFFKKTHIRPYS